MGQNIILGLFEIQTFLEKKKGQCLPIYFSLTKKCWNVAAGSQWIPGSLDLPTWHRCSGWETHQHSPPTRIRINILQLQTHIFHSPNDTGRQRLQVPLCGCRLWWECLVDAHCRMPWKTEHPTSLPLHRFRVLTSWPRTALWRMRHFPWEST